MEAAPSLLLRCGSCPIGAAQPATSDAARGPEARRRHRDETASARGASGSFQEESLRRQTLGLLSDQDTARHGAGLVGTCVQEDGIVASILIDGGVRDCLLEKEGRVTRAACRAGGGGGSHTLSSPSDQSQRPGRSLCQVDDDAGQRQEAAQRRPVFMCSECAGVRHA